MAQGIKISRRFPPQVVKILKQMQRVGIYGRTVNEVVERIVCQWIIEHSMDQLKSRVAND